MAEEPGSNSLLYLSVGFIFTVFAVIGGFIFKLYYDEKQANDHAETVRQMMEDEAPRRRPRARQDSEEVDEDEDLDSDENEHREPREHVKPMGKRKLLKMQAKAEARAAREAELAQRLERKKQEEENDRKREEARKIEELEEKKREEIERAEREERERREHEEYLKLKESFQVEESGFDAKTEEEQENLMKSFVDYVIATKVVNVDELASRFQMDVESAVEKIKYFIENQMLTGVLDDRGKFIYISQAELDAVARFINQRGRISLQDLADYSNRLISFQPDSVEA